MPPAARTCPVITTARLTLAAHEPGDFEDSLAMWSDPIVVKYFGGVPSTGEEVWARLLRYAGLWSMMGFGYWRLRETATGRYVGEAGFQEARRALTPPFFGTPEAGWGLAPWAHGQGFAAEAAEAMYAWADRAFSDPRTVCMINPQNAPSLALAARLGFKVFANVDYRSAPIVLLERFARETVTP